MTTKPNILILGDGPDGLVEKNGRITTETYSNSYYRELISYT